MKLIAPATLANQLAERGERLDRLSQVMGETVALWRARAHRHRVAIAVLGGGIAGMSLAMRGRSLVRAAAQLTSALIRALALSAMARARVRYAVSRASRKAGVP